MSAVPSNLASAAPPSGAGARVVPGAFPAGGAVPGAPARPADFASDLAHLLTLLTGGGCDSAEAALPSPAETSPAEAAAATADTVSALWAELGLALPRELAPPTAGGPPSSAASTTASAATRAGSSLPATSGSASTAPSAADAALAAAPIAVEAATAGAAEFADPLPAPAPGSADDAGRAPAQSLVSLAAFAPAEPARHGAVATPLAVVDVHQPQAPQQIAETVAWHVAKGVSEVQIRLNPENLGPLDIQLKLDGDKVSVRFDMADASTRDVVQTSLPSLASLLAARGLQLDQAQVFSQGRGHGTPQQPQPPPSMFSSSSAENGGENPIASAVRSFVRRGLLDDYA